MRLPDEMEKKKLKKSFRSLFIKIVAPDKQNWEELTKQEKKQVDEYCERHLNFLQF